MGPEFFHQLYKQKPSKMRLNYTANSFVFGHINRKYAPRTYSVNLAGAELPMRLNYTANSFVFVRKNHDSAPRTFLSTSQGENFQNASEIRRKELRFWTHKS